MATGLDTGMTRNSLSSVPRRHTLCKRKFVIAVKADIVELCELLGSVIAEIARDHDLGSNLVKRLGSRKLTGAESYLGACQTLNLRIVIYLI